MSSAASLSRAWKYFQIKDKDLKLANCKICQKTLSYRASVTNLIKHTKRRHKEALQSEDYPDIFHNRAFSNSSSSENEDDECLDDDTEGNKAAKVSESTENKNEEESICLLCQETFVDQNSSKMMEHMFKVHNISQIKLVDSSLQLEEEETVPDVPVKKSKLLRSNCWKYFVIKDRKEGIAICNFCDRELSFKTTLTNLKKHLKRKHNFTPGPEDSCTSNSVATQFLKPRSPVWSFFKYINDDKTVCACILCNKEFNTIEGQKQLKKHLLDKHPEAFLHHKTDGELMTTSNEENNDESEEENLHEEYLDFDDLDPLDTSKPKSNMDRRNSTERRSNVKPKSFERRPKIAFTTVTSNRSPVRERNNSPIPTRPKIPNSLEHFSNYAISLLQELPDNVSKKLQMNFVKQIIEAHISCSELENNKKEKTNVYVSSKEVGSASVTTDETLNVTQSVANRSDNIEHRTGPVTISNGIIIRPYLTP